MPEITLPEQPALLAEIGELSVDLPEMGKRFEEGLARLFPKVSEGIAPAPDTSKTHYTSVQTPKLEVISANTDIAVPATVVETVTFGLDEAALDDQAKARLNEFAKWLTTHPQPDVHVFGHTDLTGPTDYNDALGQTRADQVATYLISKGVAPGRISIVMSYGETKPLVATEEKSRENRRVQIATVRPVNS